MDDYLTDESQIKINDDGTYCTCFINYQSKSDEEIIRVFNRFGDLQNLRKVDRLVFIRYTKKEDLVNCINGLKNDPYFKLRKAYKKKSNEDPRSNGLNETLNIGNARQLSTRKPKRQHQNQNNRHDKPFPKDYSDKDKSNSSFTNSLNSKEETESLKLPNANSKNRYSNSREANNIPPVYKPNTAHGIKPEFNHRTQTQFPQPRGPMKSIEEMPLDLPPPPPLDPIQNDGLTQEDLDLSSLRNEITEIAKPKISESNTILIINMSKEMTFMDVVTLCQEFNPIHVSFTKSILLKGETVNYCQVYFNTLEDAKACQILNGLNFKGQVLIAKILSEAKQLFKLS